MFKTEGGRGVVIYTAHHLLATKIEIKTNYHESLWCDIKISQENVIIGGIYRSLSSCADNNDLLIELLSEITAMKHDHILITGDFNMKQIDWETMLVNGTPNSFQYRFYIHAIAKKLGTWFIINWQALSKDMYHAKNSQTRQVLHGITETYASWIRISGRHGTNIEKTTQDNWKNYTFHRNLLTHTIEHRNETHENKIASEVKHNPKQFWKYVNSKTKTKGKIADLLDSDGNIATDDYKIAEILNGNFASVFTV